MNHSNGPTKKQTAEIRRLFINGGYARNFDVAIASSSPMTALCELMSQITQGRWESATSHAKALSLARDSDREFMAADLEEVWPMLRFRDTADGVELFVPSIESDLAAEIYQKMSQAGLINRGISPHCQQTNP